MRSPLRDCQVPTMMNIWPPPRHIAYITIHNSEARKKLKTWRLTAAWCNATAGLIGFFLDDGFSFSSIVGIKWHWREWCRTLYGCNVSLNVVIPRRRQDTVYLLSLLPLSFIDKLYGYSMYSFVISMYNNSDYPSRFVIDVGCESK